ncbi:MAG: (S)-benzoin forming benzil reductase [Bacteroidota bacterium]
MKHVILTGHSKGLGEGMALSLLTNNIHLHGVSRTDNDELMKLGKANAAGYDFYACDLSKTDTIPMVMEQIFKNIDADNAEGIYLVNNAGLITPIGRLETLDPAEIDQHLRVNLLAPIYLIREFIKHTENMNTEKRVLNISSGAAQNPYHGWSIYCTGKSGMDMFTQTVAIEQKDHEYPVKLMAIAPGIIDTSMQTTIRSTTDEQFVLRSKFVELKETGQLVEPTVAGKKLSEILLGDSFRNGEIWDIRDQYE